jgi:hypothetical protein
MVSSYIARRTALNCVANLVRREDSSTAPPPAAAARLVSSSAS